MATNERAAWIFFSCVLAMGLWAYCEDAGRNDVALTALRDSIQHAELLEDPTDCPEMSRHNTPNGKILVIRLCEGDSVYE